MKKSLIISKKKLYLKIYVNLFNKVKLKNITKKKYRSSRWFWLWAFNYWVKIKQSSARRRQKGNKRFSLDQQYHYDVQHRRFSYYDPRRSFKEILIFKHFLVRRKDRRRMHLILWKYLCKWYNIKNLRNLKILYFKFSNLYYYYFSFINFLNFKLDSILSITRFTFSLPRSWDLLKLKLIFLNNKIVKNNNIILASGDLLSLSWLFFFCFKVPRKIYLFETSKRKKSKWSFLVFNYSVLSFIFLGLPPRYKLLRPFSSKSFLKPLYWWPSFKEKYFSMFKFKGTFLFF